MALEVRSSTREEIQPFNAREWPRASQEHYGKEVDYKEKDFIFAALEDGEVLGTITGKHESGVVYIFTMIVSENRRGEGIGRSLVDTVEQFAQEMNAHKLHLETGALWDAVPFYESTGFSIIARIPDHHFHQDFLIMEKPVAIQE